MMRKVLVYSEKGGVGKSSLSHMLAYGAALSRDDADDPFTVNLVHMDNRSAIDSDAAERPYRIDDIRQPNAENIINLIQALDHQGHDGLVVIDVGANKTSLAERIAPHCDLVIVPVEGDYDSNRLAMDALEKKAMNLAPAGCWAVTNRTPAPKSRSRVTFDKHIQEIPRDRILYQFPQLSAVSDLARPEPLEARSRSRIKYQAVRFYTRVESQILQNR